MGGSAPKAPFRGADEGDIEEAPRRTGRVRRLGVGAPKPGVKVPEFTSGTGRGQSPL